MSRKALRVPRSTFGTSPCTIQRTGIVIGIHRELRMSAARALRNIEQLNGDLNAVVHVVQSLDHNDKAAAGSGITPILSGMPVLVKDSIEVAKMPTVCGLAVRQGHVAPVCTQKLS